MTARGGIIIRTECQCGHHAVLTAEILAKHGYDDPATFMDWHKLSCDRCKRKGRPASVIRSWSSNAEHAPYRGSYPRAM